MLSLKTSEPWYVLKGRRGQELLEQGRLPEAIEAFEAALGGLGGDATYGRGVVLERLGRALLLAGDPAGALGRFRDALEVAGRLAPTDSVRRLRCSLRSGSGDALRSIGRAEEARRAYLAALEIGRELRDPRSQGVDQARLGALALAQGDTTDALERYRESLSALRELKEPAVEAAAWDQLARVYRQLGDWNEAGRHYREAVECERRSGPSLRLARRLIALAELLLPARPDRTAEVRHLAEHALTLAQSLDPTAAENWAAYGILGEIQPERGDLRQLARRAPLIVAVAERLGVSPSFGRAVILARLGRCFGVGGRPDLAAAYLRQAMDMAEQFPEAEGSADLLGMLRTELGDVLGKPGGSGEAALPYASEITVIEESVTDYAFDPNLLLDGPRTRRVVPPALAIAAPPEEVRPLLVPGTRTWLDSEHRIRFAPPADEPHVHFHGECTVLRRTASDVAVGGGAELIWRLLGAMDGQSAWGEILAGLPDAERPRAIRVMSELAAAGVVDVSGRPMGRFIHRSTKKGVIPAGGLEGDDALRLATEADPRNRENLPRIPVGTTIPDRLHSFHALTRSRRSSRDFRGGPLSREEFDALLTTACGVTGSIRWSGGEVKLRAYPSSGALYSVGVYPVVIRVEGLEPAVHRFDAEAHALETIGPALDPSRLVRASLPMEREMVAGIAAMFCLTGFFPRHERKYGEGGYRMMVAEAGHVSHNLVLAATALGLCARPFGGVFDRLINQALGLDEAREQFLLAVVVGR